MREILDYCSGGTRRAAPAGTEVIHEGGNTGHLFVLSEGRVEVVRGDTVIIKKGDRDRDVEHRTIIKDRD